MNLWFGFLVGLKEIWSHKFRSFLTMLGIILGVASLLSMFSLTAGMANGMRQYMQQVGGIERVGVIPQEPPTDQEGFAEISPGRTIADAEAIARSATLVSAVTPISELAAATVSFGSQYFRTPAYGVWPDYVPINSHEISRGRSLTWLDVESAQNVCVIGQRVTQRLWPDRPRFNPVGESILINGRPFKVVGEFTFYETEWDRRQRELSTKSAAPAHTKRPTKGSSSSGRGYSAFERKNSTVILPITAMFYNFKMANVVKNEDQGPQLKLDALTIQVADIARFDQALEQVRTILEATHRGIEDFTFDTRQEWFDSIEQGIRNTRLSGGIIAGISLLVGGIGITNIMLASITERIREIGVRRAVGAKGRDIFIQILVESAVIGLIGGFLGLIASFGIMRILVLISPTENAPVLQWENVILSFSFAVIIGLLSGIYPALKASKLDPIEALRYG